MPVPISVIGGPNSYSILLLEFGAFLHVILQRLAIEIASSGANGALQNSNPNIGICA